MFQCSYRKILSEEEWSSTNSTLYVRRPNQPLQSLYINRAFHSRTRCAHLAGKASFSHCPPFSLTLSSKWEPKIKERKRDSSFPFSPSNIGKNQIQRGWEIKLCDVRHLLFPFCNFYIVLFCKQIFMAEKPNILFTKIMHFLFHFPIFLFYVVG